jgi:nicotinate-nucleotide adenylyltransferase
VSTTRCIALLGGSFDPVHEGHVALARYFATLLAPDELRLIPAGNPWQKAELRATPAQRVDMLQLAFASFTVPVTIDEQETRRTGPSYTVDTLRAIRDEVGPEVSLALLIGADQLRGLPTWKDWRQLFDHAHICAASRPGFDIALAKLPEPVQREFARRAAPPEQIRASAGGLTCIADRLQVDISSTEVRDALQHGVTPDALVPPAVLDYIKQHHLYGN